MSQNWISPQTLDGPEPAKVGVHEAPKAGVDENNNTPSKAKAKPVRQDKWQKKTLATGSHMIKK